MAAQRLASPVIVVPGITASYLEDDYRLPPETVWSVTTKSYERSSLHPDDPRYEAIEPARVRSGQVFEIAYREMIAELRHNLRTGEDRPVPVYPFGYDWRKPLAETEAALLAFIDEVIDRTKLLRHYDASEWADRPRVSLVGHSMGGLIIAGALERAGRAARVDKVATLAAPFRGSFEAVIKVITGTADLGVAAPSSREREAARAMPALYHLLPSMKHGLETPEGMSERLFDPRVWQSSVVDTITQFIELRGLKNGEPKERASLLFARMLREASRHRARLERFSLADAGLKAADWLCVVGVDSTTRVRLRVKLGPKAEPQFDLSSADRMNEWGSRDDTARRMTGDGTVPYEGAVPAFLDEKNLVLVTPDDFGYWEVGDRALSAVAGFHGILPNMDMLHRLIVRHLTGREDARGNTWGRLAPGVKAGEQDWPVRPLTVKAD